MLRLNNVSYQYHEASESSNVSEINLQVEGGRFVLLCGRSGSGKSTIIKLINSLIPNYYENGKLQGDVFVEQMNTQESKVYEISRVVSSVFQNPRTQFFNVNTTSEILFYLENRGFDRSYMKERLKETAKLFKIEDLLNRDIFELSGGEKQIIAIAAAYASGTQIIVLDEPSSNLDEQRTREIGEILKKLKEAGKTIIISEHRFYYIKALIDDVYYLDGGQIKNKFSRDEFFALDSATRKGMGLRSIHFEPLRVTDNHIHQGRKELVIEKILCKFKDQNRCLAIEDRHFEYGKVIGIYGYNGVGKSTLIRLLMGLEKANEVSIRIGGKITSARKRLKESYLVMQDVNYQLFTDSVDTECSIGKLEERTEQDVLKVLEKLNLLELKDRHPMSLSGGEKQRVAIASAILSGASIICFDEPTSGMDYDNMMRISDLIKQTIHEDMIIFMISHDNEFLNRTADEIFDLSKEC